MPRVNWAALREEIEVEREWREAEMRFLRNLVSGLEGGEGDKLRRALVVMLYAHFEGGTKAILSAYANHLNNLGLRVSHVVPNLGASSLDTVFAGLRSPYKKSPLFRNELPDDSKLHQFAREAEFLKNCDQVMALPVSVPIDEVVDVEDNLKPIVLKKLLFRLGLDPTLAEPWIGEINILLRYRNKIAHGEIKDGLTAPEYSKIEGAVGRTLDSLVSCIGEAVRNDAYLSAVGLAELPAP